MPKVTMRPRQQKRAGEINISKLKLHSMTIKHLCTRWFSFALLPFLLLVIPIPPTVSADLNSDQQALLAFASSVPHERKLNWNRSNPICFSWVGIKCTNDGTRVSTVRLPGIGLIGPIPENTLGKLDALEILSLRSNRLSGDIPSDLPVLPSLHYLFLQSNDFSGKLPRSFSPGLNIIDLSSNSFVGEIPPVVQNLTRLTRLSLQNNNLTGPIPDIKLPRLRYLNVSYNNLNGSIPLSLQKFPNSSFVGNSLLCGVPLVQCFATPPPSSAPPSLEPPTYLPAKGSGKKLSTGIIIAIATGGLFLLLVLAVIVLVCFLKRKKEKSSGVSKEKSTSGGRTEKPKEEYSSGAQEAEKNKLVFFEGCTYNFDLEDLLRASAEVLGKGSYGTAYKAVLEDGTTVVVKRLKEVIVGKREFEQHMEIIGSVGQHPNVVPVRAYYHSKDEKLLVFDYLPAGNLSTLLHGTKSTGSPPLDWETRVKISLGAARGITHIHSEGGGRVIHGNIKSSNVLINQDIDGCISDFGLAPIMNFPATPRNMVGYRAPEVIETRKFTQKSDVYSFGVLLLEMLTGKAPLQSPSNDDIVDLPRWVQSVVREEWTAEVFDVELMRIPNIEEEMVQMLQIAMACVAKVPDQRPRMEDVIKMIEEIGHAGAENRPSSEDKSKDSSATPPAEGS